MGKSKSLNTLGAENNGKNSSVSILSAQKIFLTHHLDRPLSKSEWLDAPTHYLTLGFWLTHLAARLKNKQKGAQRRWCGNVSPSVWLAWAPQLGGRTKGLS